MLVVAVGVLMHLIPLRLLVEELVVVAQVDLQMPPQVLLVH
jgi:hypothetical protein